MSEEVKKSQLTAADFQPADENEKLYMVKMGDEVIFQFLWSGLTVGKMKNEFGSKPEDLVAAIGPCIGPCCFEVGDDVAAHFSRWPETIIRRPERPKPHIDLVLANRLQLEQAGILPQNIESSDECTKCGPNGFFSHRRNQTLGRIGTGIVIDY